MARVFTCDVCKRQTNEIVAKLMFTPLNKGSNASTFHMKYSHHCDVGVCCADKLLSSFDWTPRKTKAEYDRSRRKQSVRT